MNSVPDSARSDIQQLITAHRSGVVTHSRNAQGSNAVSATNEKTEINFSEQLKSNLERIKFSAHASTRLKSRNIEMTREIMGKLEKAVSGAASKGARDSLILMKDLAFIVNIPNRTVITAMDGESMKENIFTNIDSAVIAD